MDNGNGKTGRKASIKLLSPLRWILAKRIRWIIALLLGIPVLVIIVGVAFGGVRFEVLVVDIGENDDVRLANELVQQRIKLEEDLKTAEDTWQLQGISTYALQIEAIYGGEKYWEGFGGISSGGMADKTIIIQVVDGIPISIIDKETGDAITENYYNHCDTIPEIFALIHNVLEGNTDDITRVVEDFWTTHESSQMRGCL